MSTLATRLMIMLLSFVFIFSSTQADETNLKKKFFPGHYLTTTQHGVYGMAPDGSKQDESTRQLVKNNPNFRGYHNRYHWHHLETARGVYDFSKIIEDLNTAAADGKKMTVRITTKRNVAENPFPLPNYMDPTHPDFDTDYTGVVYYPKEGEIGRETAVFPNICSDIYTDRLVDLLTAMGTALDSHPALALVGVSETGQTGLKDLPTYSREQQAKFYRRMHDAANAAFPTTIFHQTVNQRGGASEADADQMMTRMVDVHGMSFGGPDLDLVTHSPLTTQFAKYYPMYRRIAPITAEAQSLTFGVERTAQQQFDFAVDSMNAYHVLWLPLKRGTFTIYDVINVVNNERGRTASGIPSSLEKELPAISAPTNVTVVAE